MVLSQAAIELDNCRLGRSFGYGAVNEVAMLLKNSVESGLGIVSGWVLEDVASSYSPLEIIRAELTAVKSLSVERTNKLRDFCVALSRETIRRQFE